MTTEKDDNVVARLKKVATAFERLQNGNGEEYNLVAEEDPEAVAIFHTDRCYQLVKVMAQMGETLPEGKAADLIAGLVETVVIMNLVSTALGLWAHQLEERIEKLEKGST
jgi:hypothetical protein